MPDQQPAPQGVQEALLPKLPETHPRPDRAQETPGDLQPEPSLQQQVPPEPDPTTIRSGKDLKQAPEPIPALREDQPPP